MAAINGTTPTTTINDRIDSFFASIGQGFNAYLERRTRRGEIERLNALSDAQLAKLGITRERIPHHVFRDLFWV